MKLVIGISGATGSIYGIKLLQILKELEIETHLVVSKAGKLAIEYETSFKLDEVIALADYYYNNNEIAARIASGSFKHNGMIVMPCTVKTMSEIAYGITGALISRAADVALKERRRLVLGFRETPLHLGHIQSMMKVTEMGAIVAPTVTAFYNHPQSLEELVEHYVYRVLDLFDIDVGSVKRWKGIVS